MILQEVRNTMKETIYLLRSRNNAVRLAKSLKELEDRKTIKKKTTHNKSHVH